MTEHVLDEQFELTRGPGGPNLSISFQPGGPQEIVQHAAASVMTIVTRDDDTEIGVFAVRTHSGLGTYLKLDAAEARSWSAAFARVADLLDGGKGKR